MSDHGLPTPRIGILGGGQLGRMMAVAASRLGLYVTIFDTDPAAPAAAVVKDHHCASFDDDDALVRFAQAVDVITYEFENIPLATVDRLQAIKPVMPGREALRVSQDRLVEKQYLTDLGLQTAPFAPVASGEELVDAVARIGRPAILKTRRFGYDGKGQVRIEADTDPVAAWAEMAGEPAILEGFVPFQAEISVIAARNAAGQIAAFDPGENTHEGGILRRTQVPANVPARLAQDAVLAAGKLLNALDYIGVVGVEFFLAGGQLMVNEFAPRVHNSGHWTQNGCAVDQFEQHIRAIAGWPLGNAQRQADVEMINLIGDDITRTEEWAARGDAALHLYGKAQRRAGRKMGHVNLVQAKREKG